MKKNKNQLFDFRTASLKEVLGRKFMYYDKIDFTIIERSWKILSKNIKLPFIIHLVGTNGKGSTGRFLAHYLVKKNYKTLHYSSPHILTFNERIWINGKDSLDTQLEEANVKLQKLLPCELLLKLTYFEYATLLALILSNKLDYLVLEAGLGGEFDATNVVTNNLSLVTTIDLDHQNFLGNSIKEIAKTKMRSVDNKMILGYQIHNEVYETALEVKKELKEEFDKDIVIQALKKFDGYEINFKLAEYLKKNLYLATQALKELNIKIDISLFNDVKLIGRCQKIRPNVTIDVGHNPLAASVLVNEFKNKKVHLIYNSYKDKDCKEVLRLLKPIINKITISELDNERLINKNNLLEICQNLHIKNTHFTKINPLEEYLVFGSFLVIEKFLKNLQIYE